MFVEKMLCLQYKPRYGVWPVSQHVPIDIPDYRITKPLDYYDKWPWYYPIYLRVPEFRTYLNNLLLRDMRVRSKFQSIILYEKMTIYFL